MLLARSFLVLLIVVGLSACDDATHPDTPDERLQMPGHFPALSSTGNFSFSAAKARLGRHLFYDKHLSADSSLSCASCHDQKHAFADGGNATSKGYDGRMGRRNSPALINLVYQRTLFWDGRARSLEEQALGPITDSLEMNLPLDQLIPRVAQNSTYLPMFRAAYGSDEVTLDQITESIASFVRTLISGSSPYDRFMQGETAALSTSAKRGMELFASERASCVVCHEGVLFTDRTFHNVGLDSVFVDRGRNGFTNRLLDMGEFKTPTLRNIELTAPYMHDGRFATLEEAVEHYNTGGVPSPYKDPLIRSLKLSPAEIEDLLAFLRSLTDEQFVNDPSLSDPW